jgi:hypothetical protein
MEKRHQERRSGLLGFHKSTERRYTERRWVKKKDFWRASQVEDSLDRQFGITPRNQFYAFNPSKFFQTKNLHRT